METFEKNKMRDSLGNNVRGLLSGKEKNHSHPNKGGN